MSAIAAGIISLIGAITAVTTSAIQNAHNVEAQKNANETNLALTKEANAAQLQQVRESNEFNAAEAQKARDFDEYMSNTQVQRAMADYQAAGLNPLLAATNGASYSAPASATSNVASIKSGKVEAPMLDLSGISSAASSLSNLLLISQLMNGSSKADKNWNNFLKGMYGSKWRKYAKNGGFESL